MRVFLIISLLLMMVSPVFARDLYLIVTPLDKIIDMSTEQENLSDTRLPLGDVVKIDTKILTQRPMILDTYKNGVIIYNSPRRQELIDEQDALLVNKLSIKNKLNTLGFTNEEVAIILNH